MQKKEIYKQIVNTITVFLLFNYEFLFKLIPVIIFNMDISNANTGILLSLFSGLCLTVIYCYIYRKELIIEWKKFKKNIVSNMFIGTTYWFGGLVIMVISNFIIMNVFRNPQAANEVAVDSLIKILPIAMFFSAGIIAPINEEIVFRKSIKNILKNKWAFVITSGLLFGLAHVVSRANSFGDWLYVIPYGSLGISFALAYYDTDSIFTSIFLHMLHNIPSIILVALM